MKTIETLTGDEYYRICCYSKALLQGKPGKKARGGFIALLLVQTGLRIGEAVQLYASDLILGINVVSNLRVRSEIAKGKKERIIPLNEQLREIIVLWFAKHYRHSTDISQQWLLPSSHTDKHITTRQAERIIGTVSSLAIGRKINPHLLRHTFATRALEVSNIRVVQILLGHNSLQSTQVYTHPNNDELTKAVNKLNNV